MNWERLLSMLVTGFLPFVAVTWAEKLLKKWWLLPTESDDAPTGYADCLLFEICFVGTCAVGMCVYYFKDAARPADVSDICLVLLLLLVIGGDGWWFYPKYKSTEEGYANFQAKTKGFFDF